MKKREIESERVQTCSNRIAIWPFLTLFVINKMIWPFDHCFALLKKIVSFKGVGGNSQNFLHKFVRFLVTLGLKILRLFWL